MWLLKRPIQTKNGLVRYGYWKIKETGNYKKETVCELRISKTADINESWAVMTLSDTLLINLSNTFGSDSLVNMLLSEYPNSTIDKIKLMASMS